MKHRSRYYPLWHSLPGVVAAYQPVRAPDHIQARYNVGAHMARVGQNNATLGVAPTWGPATGWTGNGTSMYLNTGIVPGNYWSMMIQLITVQLENQVPIGARTGTSGTNGMFIVSHGSANAAVIYRYGNDISITPQATGRINLAMAGLANYRNGSRDGGASNTAITTTTYPVFIVALNNGGSPGLYSSETVQAAVIYSRTLTANEVRNNAQQMKYCDVNPDWNAWEPQRRWFFVPAAAAFRPRPYQIFGLEESLSPVFGLEELH
jgi:hypothetical protein